ncbi:MAG: bifunctional 2-C-methyl-D-erythritol 4-phosphate cytidylyltransferase/2-C-methyl-D-erythritol 2,4-cyclodiphosphate synthase [Rhizobiales bacterium]|nr:bifunctional 2-C-methyl-D-erythritol 4-phosphate cytidylyltransferase/2-C-methyl-D-erythritol 2,4-cyclodiphosphate synthase [Hyphomicrobiales bacterium]
MKTVALIVAAGRGTRAGPGGPKQYRQLLGQSVLHRSMAAFAQHEGIHHILPVIHAQDLDAFAACCHDIEKRLEPVIGGETRQESVLAGLRALQELTPDLVLIHDGARPLIDQATISRVIEALKSHEGAAAGLPVSDTIREVTDDLAGATVPRDRLWRAQTPQGFHFAPLLKAHEAENGASHTDDVSVAQKAGMKVMMVMGHEDNIKITTAEDIQRAERYLNAMSETRSGSGFDVHRFGPGDHIMLCGIRVPHDHGLVGHSDADAGLHALTDAILGAIGDGDIGQHFPPSDPQWAGMSSDLFLAHAIKLAAQKNAVLLHVDLTIICEHPKVGPHREAMRQRIAEIAGLDVSRVSVKATTTEGLGFTGRGEGLAAQALATLRFS